MVKSLKFCIHSIKWLALLSLLVVIGLGLWLHQAERSLNFAKPWIVAAVNIKDAPYRIDIGQVSLDWTNVTKLGKLHIRAVTLEKRDGNVVAQLPELYATIDPLGFLPNRRLLHRVIVRNPRMSMMRNEQGVVEFGIEGAPARLPLSDLLAFFSVNESDDVMAPPPLPFRDFVIDDATLTFTDAITQTVITSTPFDFRLKRQRGVYDALLSAPFTVDEQPVTLTAGLRALPDTDSHVLAVQLKEFPARLICQFGTCPEGIAAEGTLNGDIAVGILDKDLSVHEFRASLSTEKALLTLPEWFEKPLKMGESTLTFEGDWAKKQFTLTSAQLGLEDTNITASGVTHRAEDGWYVKGEGETTAPLDITKVYKYWPLTMAPDSRKWITSKLKSGYAAKGTIKVNFKPEDFAAPLFPEKSIDATADARDITFEYLPGFPLVEKMNGIAHFTATTVKVEGSSGSVMSGTTINHAILWCPDLANPKNPMEVTLDLSAPAVDAVTLLALKHFPFDDKFGLDAKTIQGSADAKMLLKFDAFSGNENADPNEIHLESVDYDIAATLKELAQDKVAGSYNVRAMNGLLKADVRGMSFDGSLRLGDSGINDVKLAQPSGKPLTLNVKARAEQNALTGNDFDLTYTSGTAAPSITLRGNRLDASVSYGKSENSLLANFPAMKLDINLGELLLAPQAPFTKVVGTLNCSAARCESADFSATTGKGQVKGGISYAGSVRQFRLTSNDAGSTLKALDITDRMTDGKLDLRGNYDDGKVPPQLNGRLLITEFTLKNSQILARILSIGSLTGLTNMLTGSGIAFEKMAANVTSRGGVIAVDKGIANGASLGITVGGTVDTNTTKLALKGTLAPAYALNSIFSKIPLIGAIAGGDAGLIAFNYSVNGTYEEPDVGVNPLSGLTPGFLRGIFSGAETSENKNLNGKPDNRPVGQKIQSNVHRQ